MRNPLRSSRHVPSREEEVPSGGASSSHSSPATSLTDDSPPPAYSEFDTGGNEQIDVDLEAAFSNLDLNACSSTTPKPDECIAHLKLLECFKNLREEISNRNGLFGIEDGFSRESLQEVYDNIASECANESEQREKFAQTGRQIERSLNFARDKRWAIYVARAASRYAKWWQKLRDLGNGVDGLGIPPSKRLRVATIEEEQGLEGLMGSGIPCQWNADNLPPIGTLQTPQAFFPQSTDKK